MSTMTMETASPSPTRNDGSLHRYELVYAGHTRRVYADTEVALIDVLIPGYAQMTSHEAWEARIAYLIRAQVIAQAGLNAVDAFATLPAAQQTILQGPRHEPPVVAHWSCPIPLILVATYYEPAGRNARPVREAGMEPNVIWVDPSDDTTFLTSLHDIGVISLYVSG